MACVPPQTDCEQEPSALAQHGLERVVFGVREVGVRLEDADVPVVGAAVVFVSQRTPVTGPTLATVRPSLKRTDTERSIALASADDLSVILWRSGSCWTAAHMSRKLASASWLTEVPSCSGRIEATTVVRWRDRVEATFRRFVGWSARIGTRPGAGHRVGRDHGRDEHQVAFLALRLEQGEDADRLIGDAGQVVPRQAVVGLLVLEDGGQKHFLRWRDCDRHARSVWVGDGVGDDEVGELVRFRLVDAAGVSAGTPGGSGTGGRRRAAWSGRGWAAAGGRTRNSWRT